MKRLIVLGVTALFFIGCTITFTNDPGDTGGNNRPTVAISSPVSGTYYELADVSSIDLIGTVLDDGIVQYVQAKIGITPAGGYSIVPGTSNINALSVKGWTNNFNISAQVSGTKYFYAFAKDISNSNSLTNSKYVYFLDEDEANNATNISDTISSDGTLFRARTAVANDVDYYDFQVSEFANYEIYTTNAGMGTDLDTYIVLMDSGGTILNQDDDGGTGTFSKVVYALNTGFTFYIFVSAYNTNEIGDYAIVVKKQ
ncbi:MAG: hypothetical protein A2Y33_00605 [Spirochaetes bacterium GWF1_51_8]|nr:MAG: hypothetical protein A2Y33_00605 [Spirochaetes bacterium GWF1_51_8]